MSAGGQTVMDVDSGISLSENPTLRIATRTPLATPVTLEATDLPTLAHYTGTWQGRAGGDAAKTAATSGSR